LKKDIITAVVQLNNYRFPKGRNPNPGESSIVLLNVKEITEGEIPEKAFSPYGEHAIIVKGVMPKLDKDVDYVLQAKQVVDPKWGIQYLCEGIRMDYDLDKKEDQIKFFSYFLTENQIESLYSMYDNPVPILKNSDIESLTKIKGIGPVTASRICMKYADNIANGRAYIVLKGLGLTKNAIDNLIKQFGSADMVIDTIETNPYSLIKLVRGYGWEKADKIALGKGFSRCCRERCVAYARYRLEKEADDGNSCMSIEELIAEVMEVCYPVERQDLVVYLKEDMIGQKDFEKLYQDILDGKKGLLFPSFFYSKDTQKVGLLYYRLIEKKIVTELSRLHDAKSDFVYDKDKCEHL
jgi:exodeoxyribonuclease V alpha subunit